MSQLPLTGAGPSGAGIAYLLRDEFTTDRAAGAVNGTAAEPGPGTRTGRDVENKLSISSGVANFAAQATPVYAEEDLVYADVAITRAAGRLLKAAYNLTTDNPHYPLALVTSITPTWGHTHVDNAFFRSAATTLSSIANATAGPAIATIGIATAYQLALVLKTTGAYLLIKGGAFTNWTLLWIAPAGNTATLYAAIAGYTAVFKPDSIRIPDVLWLPTPVAYDTFTRANGALGDSETTGPDAQAVTGRTWTFDAGIWTVDTNEAKGSPVAGSEELTNVEFTVDTSAWTALGGATLTRRDFTTAPDIDPTGGVDDFGLEVTTDGTNNVYGYQDPGVSVGDWVLVTTRVHAPSSNTRVNAAFLLYYSPLYQVSAEDIWETLTVIERCTSAEVIKLGVRANNAGDIAYFDAPSVKVLTLSELFASVDDGGTNDVVISVDVTIAGNRSQGGVVMNLDDEITPANFVLGYHDGTTAKLDKCVAGVYTSVISAAATYAAGATLVVIKDGNDYALFYNNSKIGSTSTISDAGIVDNTKHGLFSTYSGNTLDNFTVFPRGGGAYSDLDLY